ncbi:MAG TPA: hypothetical protein VKM54_12170 [Myxococcota bacterium]|nr:hypothetical protein [Myxococcota bacterium]
MAGRACTFNPDSEKARDALKRVGEHYGQAEPKVESFKEWTIYRQEAKQGEVVYSLLDAKRNVADVAVGVRLAWPHLRNNPPGYDAEMEVTFRSVLDSIYGNIGPYQPKPGEVIRRPTQ